MITKKQLVDIFRLFKTNWGNFEADNAKIALWEGMVSQWDLEVFKLAVKAVLENEKFPPNLATMREYYEKLNFKSQVSKHPWNNNRERAALAWDYIRMGRQVSQVAREAYNRFYDSINGGSMPDPKYHDNPTYALNLWEKARKQFIEFFSKELDRIELQHAHTQALALTHNNTTLRIGE